jgi:uncharacterized protein YacL
VLTLSVLGAAACQPLGLTAANYIRGGDNARYFTQMDPAVFAWLAVLAGLMAGFLFSIHSFNRVRAFVDAVEKMPPRDKVAAMAGLLLGTVFTVLGSIIMLNLRLSPLLSMGIILAMGYMICSISVYAMMSMKRELFSMLPSQIDTLEDLAAQKCKILDTNVIIDGRIADVCRTGFVEGPVYVPGFVLDELQHIADSGDSLKRARGRRGLDILHQMQKDTKLLVRSFDLPADAAGDEVDLKLVKLAKLLNGAIITNDYNLNKVAELQGVQVLNLNELANSLKPVVLPGEEMTVTIIKEGKEPNQGVAYLDDGTMVVVEGGRHYVNSTLEVVVSSVLQTIAGKMIFADAKLGNGAVSEDAGGRNLRSYPGGRSRRKVP